MGQLGTTDERFPRGELISYVRTRRSLQIREVNADLAANYTHLVLLTKAFHSIGLIRSRGTLVPRG